MILFKQYEINKKFNVDTFSLSRNDLERESCPLYGKFIGLIREFIKSSNYGAIRLLKVPIAIYFNENQEDLESDAKIFADAFKKIIPYWEGIDLQ